MHFTSREISEKYDRFARWYDLVEGIPDLLGVRKLRQQLLRGASGKVLEVAIGTGKNLQFYPSDCRITALDVSNEMLNVARKRAAKLSTALSLLLGDGETLPFPDESFDTVVSPLTTCTFPDPVVAALREMRRICGDLCVVGAGIAGTATAYLLAREVWRNFENHSAMVDTAIKIRTPDNEVLHCRED